MVIWAQQVMRPMRALVYSCSTPWIQHIHEVATSCGVTIIAVIFPSTDNEQIDLISRAVPDLKVEIARDLTHIEALVHRYHPELGICIGFSWKISYEIIAYHPRGILNGHPSLLPDGRGPFPIAWAIREGRKEMGFTFHLMSGEYDQGPVLAQGTFPMPLDTSPAVLRPLMMRLSGTLLPEAIARVRKGDYGEVQDEQRATWAKRFEDDYLKVDWARTRSEIDRQVRAWQWMHNFINGKPRGPLTILDGRQVRVIKVSINKPGHAEGIRMETADGPIWIMEAEPVIKD